MIESDAIKKGLEIVGREIPCVESPAGDVRWYMGVLRTGFEQREEAIEALGDALEAVWRRGLASPGVYAQCEAILRKVGRIP